jgi:hypothetical protein
MSDHSPVPPGAPSPGGPTAVVTLRQSIHATVDDLIDLETALHGPDAARDGRTLARVAGRLAEEVSEVAVALAALPGAPPPLPGHACAGEAGEDPAALAAAVLERIKRDAGEASL